MSVTDACARTITQYSVPVSASSSPIAVLGPKKTNDFGLGGPGSPGYNATPTKLVTGDAYGWINRGKVAGNQWEVRVNKTSAVG